MSPLIHLESVKSAPLPAQRVLHKNTSMRNSSSPAPSFPICSPAPGGYCSLPHRASQPHGLRGELETRQLGETELPRAFLCSRMEGAWPPAPVQISPVSKHYSLCAGKGLQPRPSKGRPVCSRCKFLPSFRGLLYEALPSSPRLQASVARVQPHSGASTSSGSAGGEGVTILGKRQEAEGPPSRCVSKDSEDLNFQKPSRVHEVPGAEL